MATQRLPIGRGIPDSSGQIYPSTFNAEMSLTNAKLQECTVMSYPTSADIGVYVSWEIPTDYVGSPVIVAKGVIDGTPANTFAMGVQQIEVALSSTIDVAYEAEDLANNATWTGYNDEEEYELQISLTPASAYTPGRTVYAFVFRDNSVDDTTWNFLLDMLFFQYANS